MTDPLKTKTPHPAEDEAPPDTLKQTKTVERRISPQQNTTEPYGKSDDAARDKTR